ncbi:MAG TPA: hypothetical protein QF695_08230, partial [Arenicellales bacterium]|nr:hypothetical protein [Arenicellales bacterium]
MAVVEKVGWVLVAVFIFVSFHEFGHFCVARLLGGGGAKIFIGFCKTMYFFWARRFRNEYVVGG